MTSKFALLSIGAAAAAVIAQQVAAQSTLPSSVEADRATIQQDQTLVRNAAQQLRTDEALANASAAAADRTGLRLARMKVAQDFGQLHQDVQAVLQPGDAALTDALTKLYADQRAGNASAVQADQAAVTTAEAQLRADRQAIYGGLGGKFGGWHGMHKCA